MTTLAAGLLDRASERDDFVGQTARWILARRVQRMKRRAFATLLNVDDNILEDISGLNRKQVESILHMPLHLDAVERAKALQQRRRLQ